MTSDVEHLRTLAQSFRRALERTDRRNLIVTLAEFPNGACGDAALLLGAYLQDEGLGASVYVLGRRDGCYHAWIELEGITIDITADQFSEINQPVIVCRRSSWHDTFEQERLHQAHYSVYDDHTVFELHKAYQAVLSNLE